MRHERVITFLPSYASVFQSHEFSKEKEESDQTDAMTFICRAANLAKQDEEANLMRLQVNDCYIAYTNDFGPEEVSDQIVLKGSIYAVR